MYITLLGKRWRLRFLPNLGDARGKCDPPDSPGKEIRIWRSLRGRERLEVLIHEMLHATNWPLDEEHVEQTAEGLATALWRLGYRASEEKRCE